MAHYLDKDGLLRFFQGLKNVFAAKNHSHTTVNGHTVNADVPSGAKFTDTVYTHPSYTSKSSGLYKVTVDSTGHVSATTAVAKSDITALGIPAQDTTYSSKAAASGGTDISLVTTGEKYTWNSKTSNTGTVTSVATGVGLTGGSITTSGTIKAKLRSETALTRDSAAATETANRVYPVVPDKSGYLAVNVPWTDTNTQTITGVKGNSESSYRTGNVNLTAANIGAAAATHSHAASDISSGTLDAARIPSLDASKIGSGTLAAARLPAMTGATASAAGTQGAVPAPAAGKQAQFLRGDGTWATPTDTNTDTKVNVTLATTTKAFLLGTSTTPTSSAKAVTALADTGVYLDTTAGKLTATSFAGNGASLTSLNGSNISSGTVAAARIASLDASKISSGTLSRDRLPGGLYIDMGTISSLPITKTFTGVRTDMVVARMELGTPSAQRSDWTVNTDTANSITVSGTISGSTTCKILLVQAESGTAS